MESIEFATLFSMDVRNGIHQNALYLLVVLRKGYECRSNDAGLVHQ